MSHFAPIEAVNLGDRAIAEIRAAIVSGALPPLTTLRDREVAEQLGVSRTPVRDALHRLQSEGLVEPRGRQGWVVTDFSEQDVRELFQLRMMLEPVGIDSLERTPDADQITRIAAHFTEFSHPIPKEQMTAYFARDDSFHQAIVAASGNRRMIEFYSVLNAHINRGRYILSGSRMERMEQTLDEHQDIVRALIAHDFATARSALIDHLRTGEQLMLRELRERNSN